MYKIIGITDKKGHFKTNFFAAMKSCHPCMSGEILYPELIRIGGCFCLLWDDDSGKMLRTSAIENYENDNGKVKVVTKNSIYYLKKLNKHSD